MNSDWEKLVLFPIGYPKRWASEKRTYGAVKFTTRFEIFRNKFQKGKNPMNTKMTMVYWKGEKFWLGKLLEHPEIMSQGETLQELEENIRDAYMMMAMEDVPQEHKMKAIAI